MANLVQLHDCGVDFLEESLDRTVSGIPWPLHKAMHDPFRYAVIVRGGFVIAFDECIDNDEGWLTLLGAKVIAPANLHLDLSRGFCVRLDAIEACIDAPEGS